jgi:hypothetical protein
VSMWSGRRSTKGRRRRRGSSACMNNYKINSLDHRTTTPHLPLLLTSGITKSTTSVILKRSNSIRLQRKYGATVYKKADPAIILSQTAYQTANGGYARLVLIRTPSRAAWFLHRLGCSSHHCRTSPHSRGFQG